MSLGKILDSALENALQCSRALSQPITGTPSELSGKSLTLSDKTIPPQTLFLMSSNNR
jgi:hypothetical protein